MTIDDTEHRLPREAVIQLQESASDALTERRTFFRTSCIHRDDGTYVVERRGAETTGNSVTFERFDEIRRLFDRLPTEFTADDLTRSGITGSRRHMLVRHFAEHPTFPCELASRNPIRAKKVETA